MSQENVDALRAVYEEWGRGNFRAGVDLYEPLTVFIPFPEFPGTASHFLGAEGVRDFMLSFLGAWSKLTIEAESFLEAGDSVIVGAHWTGVGRESGAVTEYRVFDTWSFRGRVAIRFESFRKRADALEAVGRSE